MKADTENHLFLQPLFNYLAQIHPLSEPFINHHKKNCDHLQIKKNKFILSPIDNNDSIYFLVKGLLRAFIREGENDISTRFAFENQFIEAMQKPGHKSNYSIEYLQALEDCELIRIPYKLIDFLNKNYLETQIINRKLLERSYHEALERSLLARIPSALGRYLKFEASHPGLNRIPQRYLSSYLVMRLETLSRIRNKALDTRLIKMT
ncbi:CRP-like cAMP-binding protein [Pedobacter psychrotolerans]|uniref:CRP-like cAMP-binding protein n=1 Tax=Pedobacter psychrotolerans TaxID=1843235 RepID=A0A4R2HL11_9SPHI|nr:Crp/Fnr family transcriptional regulator [Pedobacter psychrotolerans]TCO30777.1 CRP-like cAMP-binding protein [Pedobacter psychrotolerans]GGE44527.1 cyclic nucleotide-binding protein [Pedobacter psychrotolerans]